MKEFTLPALTAGIQNQGLNNYVPKNNATILKQVISISANGANTGATFYQKHPFTVLQDAYAIKLKKNELSKLNDNQYLFFVSAISKSISNMFEWTNKATWERVKERKISLPTKKGNIDYDFMDSFVAELEAQRVAELEAYLKTTGLNDYELTDEEKKVLSLSEKTASNEVRYSADNAKNETIKFKPFKLGELFKSQTGDVDLQQKDINGKGVYFVNSGNTNYGIKGKTDRKAKIFLKNTITIDFFGNAYYRNYEYKLATHNHVFSLSGNVIKNHLVGQYLISTMQYLTKIYGYSLMATWTKLKENEIKLPVTENGEINFDYMEKYITAIEKLTIKNVVEYKDKLIEQTKKLVD